MDIGLPFAALGSGGLAAMAVLEEGYSPNLSLEDAVRLVQKAIVSGIRNDLGSGSQVDLCVIYPDGTSRHTRCSIPEEILEDVQFEKTDDVVGDETKQDDGVYDESTTKTRKNTPAGVNGFGNLPFAVESTRQRVVSIKTDKESRKKVWDKVLGL
jgi:20S proteasome subunit beta 2